MKKIIIVILTLCIVGGVFLYVYKKDNRSSVIENYVKSQKISYATDFYAISAEYPIDSWDKKEVMKQMVDYMVNQKKEEWKNGGELYNAEQKLAKDFPDRPKMKYELNISYVATSSEKMKTRSYIFSVYEFTGGAHGNTAITSFNFTKDTQLKVEDIVDFSSGGYVSLAKVLKTKILSSLGENTNENMVNDGLGLNYLKTDGTFDKEKCNCDGYYFPSNVQVFTIHDEGVKFIFTQYQVAPYVVGTPSVLLTWSEFEKFINKDNYLAKQPK